ncbi:MAG: TlpA family protein disulfide reductase [Sphingobacteriales bacterium]|nr:TlpA family protein disulfide reductase [Sphingobacteriales bacterium]
MKLKYKCLLTGVVLLLHVSNGVSQPFEQGDRVPDIRLSQIFNFAGAPIQLSSIKGKLIIFDFWDFSCISCIKAFPEIDMLQKKFKERVQFFLVNKQTVAETRNFLAKRPKLMVPEVPFICQDNVLANKWFPHEGKPFHVWIDSNFRVRYLLSGHNTTAERIDSFLNSKVIYPQAYLSKRYISTLIDSALANKVLYNSVITRSIPNVKVQSPWQNGSLSVITADCQSLPELLVTAFNENGKYNFARPGRLRVELEDSLSYRRPTNMNLLDAWELEKCYNYELVVPAHLKDSRYALMRQEICRYFDVEAFVERRKMPGIVIFADSNIFRLATKGGRVEKGFGQASFTSVRRDSIRSLRNVPYSFLSDKLVYYFESNFKKPVIDQIKFEGNVDIDFEGRILDEPDFQRIGAALKKYGIVVREEQLETEVLIIRKRCGQSPGH